MTTPNHPAEHRKIAAIMFTDMVGFSALAHQNEALALDLLAEQQRLLRTHFAQFDGQWCRDTYDPKFWWSPASRTRDPVNLSPGLQRVIRGGAWHMVEHIYFRTAFRGHKEPLSYEHIYGFRCVSPN